MIPTLRSSLRLTNALLPLWQGHRRPLSRASGKHAFVSSSSLYTALSFSYTHPASPNRTPTTKLIFRQEDSLDGTSKVYPIRTNRPDYRGRHLGPAAAEKIRPSAISLTLTQTAALQPFFPTALLTSLRILDVSQTAETIPYPPFYERVRAGGSRVVPDPAHMTAIPFVDVALFNREPTLRTLFHNLVHVAQFSVLGVERVTESYFHVLNESGLWMVAPVEEQAYQLDGRYTKDPTEIFSVADEIQEWLRSGRY